MEWPALKTAVATCEACGLCKTRTNTVFGVGDERAEWVIVGEAPGAEEDARGEPFVGQAGRLLDSMLAAVALRRGENVYIANVLKCRPPGNRNPEPFEVAQCSPHLVRQIELIRPKVILAMGRAAAQLLLEHRREHREPARSAVPLSGGDDDRHVPPRVPAQEPPGQVEGLGRSMLRPCDDEGLEGGRRAAILTTP